MCIKNFEFVPKTFLCIFPLKTGAISMGILIICILIILLIASVVQVVYIEFCIICGYFVYSNCYAYSITAIVYIFVMVLISVWYLWGITKEKPSVVLSWVVITSTLLMQTICLLIILICMYAQRTSFISWLLSLICGLIAIAALVYGVLVAFGFWRELKSKKETSGSAS